MAHARPMEGPRLEYKRQVPSPKQLAKELIALANTRGGELIIGYDEKSRRVYPVTPDQGDEERIANIVCEHCEPRLSYTVAYETWEDGTVMVLSVEASTRTPHYLRSSGLEHGSYVRVGSTTRLADREELARLIRRGKAQSYDLEPIGDVADIDRHQVRAYLNEKHRRFGGRVPRITHKLLEDLRLADASSATVAGMLLFGRDAQSLPTLEHAYLKCARFLGRHKGKMLDQTACLGTLDVQIEQATAFVLRNITHGAMIHGTRRSDTFAYPESIVREMIVNAVVHRDYSRTGMATLIAVYDDRIEVTSPGGLGGAITVDDIAERQYSRNPVIAKRLFELGYFDEWGQGIDRILAWSQQSGSKPPLFEDSVTQFSITVFGPAEILPRSTPGTRKPGGSAWAHDRASAALEAAILEYVQREERVTNREVRQHLGASKTEAQTALSHLMNDGQLTRMGAGRSTYYVRPKPSRSKRGSQVSI